MKMAKINRRKMFKKGRMEKANPPGKKNRPVKYTAD